MMSTWRIIAAGVARARHEVQVSLALAAALIFTAGLVTGAVVAALVVRIVWGVH